LFFDFRLLAVAAMKVAFVSFALAAALTAAAQTAVNLPEVTVYSTRVANQTPTESFAMPVSALRYEPVVDIQARNIAEGQADVTIRGGIFENTGFRLGAVSVLDPQTGHYLAEIPVPPAMLSAPQILTGADVGMATSNATVGAVSYGWRPIRTGGVASVGFGQHRLEREEVYQGYANAAQFGRTAVGADVALAHSRSAGAVPFGEHHFDRVGGRLQLKSPVTQTDIFAGYQGKFFGWPNLYTPFNSDETENLETLLLAVNHRVALGGGDFVEAGAFHRRNKDDYAFNRFAPLGPTHPFQHTTWENGAAIDGRRDVGAFVLNARAELLTDFLKSTSLTAGRYHSRTLAKAAIVPEKIWSDAGGGRTIVKAGASYDDSNRDHGTFSPIFEAAREFAGSPLHRIYASYARSTQEPSYTALNSSAASGLFRGNANLGRETSRNLEVGAAGQFAGWTAQAAIFGRRDDALVDWTFKRGVTARTANAVDIDTAGFESVVRRSWSRFDLVLGYTALTKDPDYRGAPVDASFYALNYARHRVTAALVARVAPGVELRIDNVARIQAANSLRVTGGDRAVFTTAGVVIRPAMLHNLELTAQVDNVWNSSFQAVPAVPATRREWSMGASLIW
jgi:vitamin B12 transporter